MEKWKFLEKITFLTIFWTVFYTNESCATLACSKANRVSAKILDSVAASVDTN